MPTTNGMGVPFDFVKHQRGTALLGNGAKGMPADGADLPVFIDLGRDVAKEPLLLQNLKIFSEITIRHWALLGCGHGLDLTHLRNANGGGMALLPHELSN